MSSPPTPALAHLAQPLALGKVVFPNRVFLAPMSGVSDVPFRALAAKAGAGMVVSEMVAGESLLRGEAETVARALPAAGLPHVVQLAGREPRWMAEGARAAVDAGADLIDINMGCPAKRVTGGYSGSALMRDLDHALSLIEATVSAVEVPVTLKMRLGWDAASLNAPELARRAELAGVSMVTVHGRTRCQFYDGSADWAAIRAVREAISIPLVANGDLTDETRLAEMVRLSAADAVMIGRGSYGRPWLPGAVARFAATGRMPAAPSGEALAELVRDHYRGILGHYGTELGVRCARKHLGWYLDQLSRNAEAGSIRGPILRETDPDRVERMIENAFLSPPLRRAA